MKFCVQRRRSALFLLFHFWAIFKVTNLIRCGWLVPHARFAFHLLCQIGRCLIWESGRRRIKTYACHLTSRQTVFYLWSTKGVIQCLEQSVYLRKYKNGLDPNYFKMCPNIRFPPPNLLLLGRAQNFSSLPHSVCSHNLNKMKSKSCFSLCSNEAEHFVILKYSACEPIWQTKLTRGVVYCSG